ncbi:MAG: sensor histidine kinase [Aristaeellaceae bacterium]
MKRIVAWLRRCGGRLLDMLGRLRLMTILTATVVIAVILFTLSLLLSNRIAQGLIHSEYEEYNETIFRQAEAAINRSVFDLSQLSYTFMSNDTVGEYLRAGTFDTRTSMMDSLKAEFDRLITIQSDIKSILLYDLSGKTIASASTGSVPTPALVMADSITFSGRTVLNNRDFFSIHLPVYNLDSSRRSQKLGYCQIIVSMDFLRKSLEEILPNPDYFCLLTDGQGKMLLKEGDIPPELMQELLSMEELSSGPEGQVLYQARLDRTPWIIHFGVPQKQLYASINLLQRNYLITYLIIGCLLLLLFVAIYAGVLRPIRTQIQFMTYYAANRTSRMPVASRNEMGQLASHLNQMLDDIDQLTAENVKAQQRILEAQYQEKQSELFAYRNQVNPHFLRNTFETIRGMALYHHVEDIAAITESLSELFSYNLLGKGYAPIREIQAHIENYTAIIRYRFNNRHTIVTDIAPETLDVLFPKMVVQPLVENAIFHGLETVEQGGSVSVTISQSPDALRLLLTVADNGHGMTPEELKTLEADRMAYDRTNDFPARKHGVGIINIYRRLRLFYGDALEFSIDSALGKGTTVRISVPCGIGDMEAQHVPGFFD